MERKEDVESKRTKNPKVAENSEKRDEDEDKDGHATYMRPSVSCLRKNYETCYLCGIGYTKSKLTSIRDPRCPPENACASVGYTVTSHGHHFEDTTMGRDFGEHEGQNMAQPLY
jgi:hypothetical protein